MRSLKGRLTTGLVITLVVVFVLQWALVSVVIRRVTEHYIASRLEHDLESLLGGLAFAADGTPRLAPERLGTVYQQPFSGHYYRVQSAGHVIRSRSLWDQDLDVPAPEVGAVRVLHLKGPEGGQVLAVVRGYRKQGNTVTMAVAEKMDPVHREIARFQYQYLLLSLAVFALLVVLQRYSVSISLAPLEQMRTGLSRLARGEVERIDENVPLEVRGLTREINHLLEVLARRLTHSRTALGNLAHALKTPLTLLLQLAAEPQVRAHPEVHERLVAQTRRVRELINRELKRARLAGEGASGSNFNAGKELPALVAVLRRMYQDKDLDIEWSAPGTGVVPVERQDMLELLGNLAENACKWARRRVRILLHSDGGLRLRVEDDGPGCPVQTCEQLGQRGLRLDESTEGHGLGLAIVRDVVGHYGGEVGFGRSTELGGFLALVHIPPPALPPQ